MLLKLDKKDDCIAAGMVVVDTKKREYNGKKFVEIGISMGKDANGNRLPIINVTAWGRTPDVQKGDRIVACGKLKITQKDDKTYYSLTADFVAKESLIGAADMDMTPVDASEVDSVF